MDLTAFRSRLLAALDGEAPQSQLRAAALRELRNGATEQDLLAAVEAARPGLPDKQEDELLVLLDAITGWCSPGQRLDP